MLINTTSRFFALCVLVRLIRVVLTLRNAYVEIWAHMGRRIDSDDLRWSYRAEQKQFRGVMTTGRGADPKRLTAIKPNHDVVHTILFPSYWARHLPETLKPRDACCSEESHSSKPLAAVACKAAQRH